MSLLHGMSCFPYCIKKWNSKLFYKGPDDECFRLLRTIQTLLTILNSAIIAHKPLVNKWACVHLNKTLLKKQKQKTGGNLDFSHGLDLPTPVLRSYNY